MLLLNMFFSFLFILPFFACLIILWSCFFFYSLTNEYTYLVVFKACVFVSGFCVIFSFFVWHYHSYAYYFLYNFIFYVFFTCHILFACVLLRLPKTKGFYCFRENSLIAVPWLLLLLILLFPVIALMVYDSYSLHVCVFCFPSPCDTSILAFLALLRPPIKWASNILR